MQKNCNILGVRLTRHLRGVLVVLLLMLLGGSVWAQTRYVFYNATYGYLNNNGTTVGLSGTFNPSCVWVASGGLGNTSRTIYSYSETSKYLRGATDGTLSLGEATGANSWRGTGTYLRYRNGGTNYYVTYNGNSFAMVQTPSNYNGCFTYYSVTINSSQSSFTAPTISGGTASFSATGNATFQASSSTYTPACTTYTFNGSTYYSTDNGASAISGTGPSATTDGVTYTWSLSGIASQYATVDPSAGVVTCHNLPDDQTQATLTLTASHDGVASKTATKTITFAAKKYSVNKSTITGGDISISSNLASRGTTITLTAAPDATHTFDNIASNWTVTYSGGSVSVTPGANNTATFTMPAGNVTVNATFTPNPSSLSLTSSSAITVYVGSTSEPITYSLSPDPCYSNVTFSSSNTGVATVSSTGVVTGVSLGTATITVTANKLDGTTTQALTKTVTVTVKDRCATPTITGSGLNYTLACSHPSSGVAIYYTTDGTTPSSTNGTPGTSVTLSGYNKTIKAIAVAAGYDNSPVAELYVSEHPSGSGTQASPYVITNGAHLDEMKDHLNAYYVLGADITAGTFTSATNFAGTFDGQFYTITGLTQPLFSSVASGTVKNVILDNVNISVNGDVGAITNRADGAKIYNCGVLSSNGASSVTSTASDKSAGGLVGYALNSARVVNCYSYATVLAVTNTGGVVGYAENNVNVTNCMMYGDMTTGTNRSPVYFAWSHTSSNGGRNEYNYYRSKSNLSYTSYNDQLAIDKDEYLTRFPFYRHIQNTHRELASYYLFGDYTQSHVNEIGHWVLKPEVAPYPIIESWETNTHRTTQDIANNLPSTTDVYEGKLLKEMGSNGYLRVNYTINGTKGYLNLPITDMDTLNYDFTWGKVVMPFVNEISGWTAPTTSTTDYGMICTGWKITSVTGGTEGSLTNYNFADRDCTAKDLYSNSGFIFAQGGNYIVPYGVTAIDVDANFANAYYLSDPAYDIVYNASYGGATNFGGTVATTYNGKTVYTSLSTLLGKMSAKNNPHAQAIVLVGNYHYNQNVVGELFSDNTTKGLTIMSIDKDNNQEPDYGWYSYHTTARTSIPPMRFDFVPNIGIGMAARTTSSNPYPSIGIWYGKGWFELTETCVSIMSECEIQDANFSLQDHSMTRFIVNSGYFVQIVRGRSSNNSNLSYLQIGGNAYVKELYPGSHTDGNNTTTICPINVTGGEVVECYMTGYNAGANAAGGNKDIYFWSAGGRIHKFLGAYLEAPATGANMTAKVDHALIRRFFGGGTSTSKRITGNINVTMNNSMVDFYCGGPEFGDMASGKTVTTNAKGSTFRKFYGAGYGGTSITYYRENQTTSTFDQNLTYPPLFSNYTNNRLSNPRSLGYGSCYKFEYILYSGGGGSGVSRFYTGYASFSLAQTGSVTSTLEDCTILNDFYGGGCQGTVAGNATSTLTSCKVYGNAFAGGYKAPATTVDVYPTDQPTYSVYTKETGLFSDFGTTTPEEYTWVYRATAGVDVSQKIIYTTTSLDQLGAVTGNATINIEGDTYVAGMIDGQPTGGVFGGGNETPVQGTTTVNINTSQSYKIANVYGGANKADVGTTNQCMATTVNITSGKIGNVYGANNVSGAKVGTITINVTQADGKTVLVDNVFGGGNLADYSVYGYSDEGSVKFSGTACTYPQVFVNNGHINGSVFGGGKGLSTDTDHATGILVGNSHVTIGDLDDNHHVVIDGNVFGGGDAANLQGDPVVLVQNCNTIVGTQQNDAGENVDGTVYGGGNAAHITGSTSVTINGGSIYRVFGGGNGEVSPANVKGDANTYIHGGLIHQAFAGSNAQGTITGTATIKVDHDNASCGELVDELYGGGNLAAGKSGVVNVECGAIVGDVYGGANQAAISNNITLNITGGTIARAFGGNNTSGVISGTITVNVEKESCDLSLGSVFGAGNKAPYTGDPIVNIKNGTVTNNVYGGGLGASAVVTGNPVVTIGDNSDAGWVAAVNGDVYGGGDAAAVAGTPVVHVIAKANTTVANVYGGGNAADVSGTDVTIDGGTITGMVFGGGHGDKEASPQKEANVNGDASVTITGGTINKVFAGSNSKGTITGSATLTVNKSNTSNPMHITEVYGGGNEAAGKAGIISIVCTGGADEGIGDVYGGANAADISNDIALTITGGKINNVFGGNNSSGAINGGITVNVDWDGGCGQNSLGNVYGGGNLAQYTIPNTKALAVNIKNGTVSQNVYGGGKGDANDHTKGQVTGNPVVTIGYDDNDKQAIVTGDVYGGGDAGNVVGTPVVNVINKCNTQIGYVYGGGNAADVSGTDVNIDGGTIGMVFGGGHGDKDATPAKKADVKGSVDVDITGGTINKVFGGSNSKGDITGSIALDINKGQNSCTLKITEVYGGGNEAAGNAGTVNIVCTGGADEGIGDVYGGANAADINSPIALNITGGKINRVFGGNNTSGAISGTINVTVDWSGSCGTKSLGTVFGAGNAAAYTGDPVVYIKNGTINNNVFGGGLGAGAVVTGNPQVTIGNGSEGTSDAVQVIGNVFGGGDAANVDGSPSVTVNNCGTLIGAKDASGEWSTTEGTVYGGGNAAHVIGTGHNTSVTINGGDIYRVFGGGNGAVSAANVAGNATTTIHGGNIHQAFAGSNTRGTISGTATISIDHTSSCPEKVDEFYGGGNLAVGGAGVVNIGCGAILDDLYGGANQADVNGDITLNITGGTIARAFGGNNISGTVSGAITVNVILDPDCSPSLGSVYGAGNQAPYTTPEGKVGPTVNIKRGTVNENVFGGGLGSSAKVTGNPVVNIGDNTNASWDAVVRGEVYGGGDAAPTTGNPVVNISKGNVMLATYGGGKGADAKVTGNPQLNVSGSADVDGYLFGGGNAATTAGNTTVNITGGVVGKGIGTFASPAPAGSIYGGGRGSSANVTGNTTVNISNSANVKYNVFGGGSDAPTAGTTSVIMTAGNVEKSIFGGGEGTTAVTKNTTVKLTGATTKVGENVYGGGLGAEVTGSTNVTIGE